MYENEEDDLYKENYRDKAYNIFKMILTTSQFSTKLLEKIDEIIDELEGSLSEKPFFRSGIMKPTRQALAFVKELEATYKRFSESHKQDSEFFRSNATAIYLGNKKVNSQISIFSFQSKEKEYQD